MEGSFYNADCDSVTLWFPAFGAEARACGAGETFLEITGPSFDDATELAVGPREDHQARYCDGGECEELVGRINVVFFAPGEIIDFRLTASFPGEDAEYELDLFVSNWCAFCAEDLPPPPPPPLGVNGSMFTICAPDDRPYHRILLPPFESPVSLTCDGPDESYVEIVLPALMSGGVYDLTAPRGLGSGAVAQLCAFEGDECTDFIGGELQVGIFEGGEFLFSEIVDGFASPGISFNFQAQAFYCSDEC